MPWNANGTFSLAQTFGTGVAPDNQFPPKVGNTLDDLASGLNVGTIFSFASTITVTFATVTASVVAATNSISTPSLYIGGVPVYTNIPLSTQNNDYTLVLGNAQQGIYHSSATSHTWTIPANSSVAYPVGTAVSFIND